MVRPESGDGEIVPILGSVVPRADELIRIPATAPRTPGQHTRRGRVIGPGQNQIRREKQKILDPQIIARFRSQPQSRAL